MQKLFKRLHKDEKGFTLVELMVVVVIIGVLVAIAVPIYNNITTQAQSAADEATARTIRSAYQMYQAGSDGDFGSGVWPDGYLENSSLQDDDDHEIVVEGFNWSRQSDGTWDKGSEATD